MPRASDIEVDIPGVGLVYFPPEMSMDAIRAKAGELSRLGLQHQHNLNRAAEADAQPVEVMGLRPAEIAEGVRLGSMFGGPLGAAYGETKAQQIEQAGGEREELNPLAIGAQAAIPGAVNLAGRVARPIAKGLYGSALKLSTKIKPEKRERILTTGLDENALPTTKSIKKQVGKQRAIEAEIETRLAQLSDRELDAQAVASRIEEVRPRFQSTTPDADMAVLDDAKKQFLRNYGEKEGPKIPVIDEFGQTSMVGTRVKRDIPLLEAQKLKKTTYKLLGDKSYGELKTSSKEADKALARGLKEEIETKVKDVFPELKALNAKDGALFDLNRALAQAANRIGNRDVIGLSIPIKVEAFGPAGFFAGLLDTPRVKAALAVAINKARHLKGNGLKTVGITRTATLPSVYEETE